MQSKKLAKSGDFMDTTETLLSTLGGNMSNLMCGSSRLDSNKSQEIGEENLTQIASGESIWGSCSKKGRLLKNQ